MHLLSNEIANKCFTSSSGSKLCLLNEERKAEACSTLTNVIASRRRTGMGKGGISTATVIAEAEGTTSDLGV